jgi:ABC-type multidrug transport system fused ATPase/permease subunit
VYFLARSDIFNTPIKRWFLAQIHLLPIYRLEEGFENLSKNEETFSACFELFKRNGMVMIFPEGRNVHEKWLRPLKKGTVKLALQTVESLGLDLQIVPAGINYTHAERPRTEVMVDFGPPIRVLDYLDTYLENKPKALTSLNRELAQRLEKQVIIEQRGTEQLTEQLLELERNDQHPPSGWKIREESRLRFEQYICQQVARLHTEQPEQFAQLSQMATSYFDALKAQALTDASVVKQSGWRFLWVLALPLIWLGQLASWPPIWYAKRIARQKVKLIEFWATVLFVLGFVLYLLYGLLLVVGGFVLSKWLGLGLLLGLPLAYFGAIRLNEARLTQGRSVANRQALLAQRTTLLKTFRTARLD